MIREAIERRFREAGVPLRLEADWRWFSVGVDREAPVERIRLVTGDSEVTVMDSDAGLRQLLLLVRDKDRYGRRSKQKFLCGMDEQSLFVVPVGGAANPLNRIAEAHLALQPREIRRTEPRRGPRLRRGQRRRPPRYLEPKIIRQGDWFFEPCPWIPRDRAGVRRRFRLGNAGGNAHVVDYLYGNPADLFGGGFGSWSGRRGNVFALGFVRHREHKPVHLRCWHRVMANGASQVRGWPVD